MVPLLTPSKMSHDSVSQVSLLRGDPNDMWCLLLKGTHDDGSPQVDNLLPSSCSENKFWSPSPTATGDDDYGDGETDDDDWAIAKGPAQGLSVRSYAYSYMYVFLVALVLLLPVLIEDRASDGPRVPLLGRGLESLSLATP